jgi:threonine dehydratase
MLAAQNVEIEVVIQTRGPQHVDAVLEALRAAGFEADRQ